LEHLERAEVHASRSIVSDIGVAAHLAFAAARSCLLNVAVNVRSLKEPAVVGRLEHDSALLCSAAETLHARVVARVDARVAPSRI
jgi:formiminotetrahydrofolate cyclodeaminase